MRKSLVTAALAGGLLVGSVVPAQATPSDHCPEEITAQEVVGCACIITVTILRDLTGDPWMCAG